MEEPSKLQSMGSQRVRHDWATSLSLSLFFLLISGMTLAKVREHWEPQCLPSCFKLEEPLPPGKSELYEGPKQYFWYSLGNLKQKPKGLLSHKRWEVSPSQGLVQFSSVQFSHSVMSDSLWPHEPQHRPPCPSPTPRVHPNSCPLSQWCHPTILSSVVPFFSCPQSFPASGSLPMSQLFSSGGQSIGVSASTSVLPMNTQNWSPLGWTGWISLQSKGLSRVFSSTTVQKHQFFSTQLSL